VVKFFSDHVLADLQASGGAVHPIIQADAIKFLYTFRNQVRSFLIEFPTIAADPTSVSQLTKEQLLSVLPLLVPHLENPSFVIHTYAAITIERILFIKQKGSFLCVWFLPQVTGLGAD
jgi:exportin-2 (importin alpha re-exporter)